MRYFRRFSLTLAVSLCLASPALASDIDSANQYVQGVAGQTLGVISGKKLTKEQKEARLEKLFADNIDFPWVGRFVMGRFWREATEEQKARYLKHYQKFLILHYTSRFAEYSSGNFKITGARDD